MKARGETEVVLLGLAFKHDTDDLRGSALLQLAQDLLQDGLELRIYDPLLDPAALIGASRTLVEEKLPSLEQLMRSELPEALGERGVVVASNRCVPVEEIRRLAGPDHHIIDATCWPELESLPNQEGICW